MAKKKATARSAKSDPRIPLSREQVIRVAVELADEGGLSELSMRELGRRLGVEAMSLYNHVANKDDVLDGMVDSVLSEVTLPAAEGDWKESMWLRAVSALDAFLRHPWAIMLIDTRVQGGMGRLRYFESVIGTLRRAGFSITLSARAFSVIDSYIYGFCRKSVGISSTNAGSADAAEAFRATLPESEFPYLAEMAAMQAATHGYDAESDFKFGMDLILDALQRARDTGGTT